MNCEAGYNRSGQLSNIFLAFNQFLLLIVNYFTEGMGTSCLGTSCSWIIRLIYALSTPTTMLPQFFPYICLSRLEFYMALLTADDFFPTRLNAAASSLTLLPLSLIPASLSLSLSFLRLSLSLSLSFLRLSHTLLSLSNSR